MPVARPSLAALALAAVASAAAGACLSFATDGASAAAGDLLRCDAGGWRYEFHVPTAGEALFDVRADPGAARNVLPEHVDLARALRRMIEDRMHVRSLDDLRAPYEDSIRSVRSLGYL